MSDLTLINGLGEQTARLLAKIQIFSTLDLVENVPRKYDDYSKLSHISDIAPGTVTIQARIHAVRTRYAKRGLHITEALASDDTGTLRVMWFNQPYRAQSIKSNEQYFMSGEYAKNYRFLVLSNPTCELVSSFPLHTARLVPQYRLTKGLSAYQLRRFTKAAFTYASIEEGLPQWLMNDKKLMSRRDALFQLHFPDKIDEVSKAKRRIAFDELFAMMLASELNREDFAREKARYVPFNEQAVVAFVERLPFKLTDDQRRAAWEILQDMTKGSPMNRLLEGDVGSGKTAVATIAAVNAMACGFQVAFMAPTEILARQHMQTIISLLPKQYINRVILLTGSSSKKDKVEIAQRIASGDILFVIGTHALLQDTVSFQDLALIIIDEQHRFGVEQRKVLQAKAQMMPHVLHMTATPIPRSIALTLYGELDVSLIRHKPSNRQTIETEIVRPEMRQKMYESCKKDLDKGRQLFVVCPLIESAEDKPERALGIDAISKQVGSWLKPYRVGILHGKMKPEDKDRIMTNFKNKQFEVLVATTVIEVGVDVPNASIMVIEGADRFGLAQLHQLRGRIGRGEHRGTCYLVTTTNDTPPKRLRVIETVSDGFRLAEYDLEIRGPGALYGTLQHGALDLRVAKITDTELIQEARVSAREFMKKDEKLVKYPQLKKRVENLRTITNLN